MIPHKPWKDEGEPVRRALSAIRAQPQEVNKRINQKTRSCGFRTASEMFADRTGTKGGAPLLSAFVVASIKVVSILGH